MRRAAPDTVVGYPQRSISTVKGDCRRLSYPDGM